MPTPEVHAGDTTLYRGLIRNDGAPIDISEATITQLIFTLPTIGTVEKDATVVKIGDDWYLTYSALGDDDFEDATPGRVTLQAYVEWADGQHYHTNKRRTDDAGRELRIHKNLEVGSP